jgi:TPR repeat protein
MKEMLQGVGPGVARGHDTKLLREILDKTAERVGKELTNQPEMEADLRATLGQVYCDLGDYTNATAMHRKALDLRRQLHGNEHPDVANSLSDLADMLRWEGRLEEAETTGRDALAMRRRLLRPGHLDIAKSLDILGFILWTQGNYADIRGEPLAAQAKYAESEPLLNEALAIQRKAMGNESLDVAQSLDWLSFVLEGEGKFVGAERRAHEGLDICHKLYGDNHPLIGHLSDALWRALEDQGKEAQAEEAYRQGLAVRQKCLSDHHPDLRYPFIHLSHLFVAQGRLQEAETMLLQVVARNGDQLVYGGKGVSSGALGTLARIVLGQGKLKEAEPVLRQVSERGDPRALSEVAWFLATTPDPAVRNAAEAVVYAEKAVAVTDRTNASCLEALAASYAASSQFTKALNVQREAMRLLSSEDSKKDFASRLRLYEVGAPYRNDGELAGRARYLLTQQEFYDAEQLLRECLMLREKQIPDDWRTFDTKSMLGGALLGQKRYADAEPLLISGYAGMKEREAAIPNNARVRCLKEALERLLQLDKATDRPGEAAQLKQKLLELDQAR